MRTARVMAAVAGLVIGGTLQAQPAPAKPAPTSATSTRSPAQRAAQIDAMSARAVAFLRAQQDKATGGWSVNKDGPSYPAISALALTGMLMTPGIDAKDPDVARGAQYVLSFRQPDGGIYDRVLPSYNTSIVLSMLGKLGTPEARAAIPPAVGFLKSLQFGDGALGDGPFAKETGRVSREHPFYGGVGYGRSGRPDGSNLNMFMQALADSGVPESDDAVRRALVFLSRTQMDEGINDMPYARGSTQGGFIYSTSINSQKQGQGQSFAGDIEESLSGAPGTVARLRVEKGPRGKPELTRDEVAAITKDALTRAGAGAIADLGEFRVLLGATPDQNSAAMFEIRTPAPSAADLKKAFEAALAEAKGVEARVEVEEVDAWKGVSRLRAYGSMTYAGFKSLIYAKLSRTDPRVTAALGWIQRHYTLGENPGLGKDGFYYYLLTFGRAMSAWGEPTITTVGPDGSELVRDWRSDLVDRLSELQQPDGSFKSIDDRWMENNAVLITSYSLIALQHARD